VVFRYRPKDWPGWNDADEVTNCAAKAAIVTTGLLQVRVAVDGMALQRLVKDPSNLLPLFHTHFFNAACQFMTTVNAGLAWVGNVGIKNFWPSALTSQRCTSPA